jgi:hypothetical protein
LLSDHSFFRRNLAGNVTRLEIPLGRGIMNAVLPRYSRYFAPYLLVIAFSSTMAVETIARASRSHGRLYPAPKPPMGEPRMEVSIRRP